MNNEIISLINRRENQILIHACIYYAFDTNLISDYQYDQLGLQLIDLSKHYPEEFKASYHYNQFKEYVTEVTPSAFNLNFRDPHVVKKAQFLLKTRKI